jgi:hypothetical protein
LRREAARSRFGDRLRRMLAQEFPGWRLEQISAESDLEHAFSAKVMRGVLRQARTAWALAACSEEEGEEATDAALTQGLAWLHHLRAAGSPGRARRLVTGLKLLLPERYAAATALRLRFANREMAQYELFSFSPEDELRRAEETDFANLATEIPVVSSNVGATVASTLGSESLLRALAELPGVELVQTPAGPACRVRGLELARMTPEGPAFGHGDKWRLLTVETRPEAEALAREIASLRRHDSADRHHAFYTAQAERWLESLLAADIAQLSWELDPAHVYSQVPALVGGHRGIIDLLAATRAGRLVVIELKASADPNLPMQALDYWMRVKWHFERDDFRRCGYFPGLELRPEPPLLWLVAPAFEFHSLNEVILRYLCPDIPIRRLGLNETWRESIQVVYRS